MHFPYRVIHSLGWYTYCSKKCRTELKMLFWHDFGTIESNQDTMYDILILSLSASFNAVSCKKNNLGIQSLALYCRQHLVDVIVLTDVHLTIHKRLHPVNGSSLSNMSEASYAVLSRVLLSVPLLSSSHYGCCHIASCVCSKFILGWIICQSANWILFSEEGF